MNKPYVPPIDCSHCCQRFHYTWEGWLACLERFKARNRCR
jgi:hypothetical protein